MAKNKKKAKAKAAVKQSNRASQSKGELLAGTGRAGVHGGNPHKKNRQQWKRKQHQNDFEI